MTDEKNLDKVYQDDCQLSPDGQKEKDRLEAGMDKKKDILIYTSNTCGYCHAAKDYLDSLGVEYTEKNVSTDPDARKELIQKRFMGVPVIIIDGETITGFDKPRLDELLGK